MLKKCFKPGYKNSFYIILLFFKKYYTK